MSSDASVFSRFVVKFVEIVAAGLATAVSGYLIAHLTGALSSPTPAPARTVVEEPAKSPVAARPASPVAADRNVSDTAPKQEVTAAPASQDTAPKQEVTAAPASRSAPAVT